MTGWGLRLCSVMREQEVYSVYSETDRATDWNLLFGRSLAMRVVFSGHVGSICIPHSWVGSEIMLYDWAWLLSAVPGWVGLQAILCNWPGLLSRI